MSFWDEITVLMRQCDRIMLLLHANTSVSQVVLAGAFYPNYFTFGQPDEEIATRELAGKDPKTTIVVGGETVAFPGGDWALGFQAGIIPVWPVRNILFPLCLCLYKCLVDFFPLK